MGLRTQWQPDHTQTAGIQFEGAPDLLLLIKRLVRRPWFYWRERRLPVIRLVRSAGGPEPLGGLEAWLTNARGAVPFARADPAESPRQPPVVEDLLDLAVTSLAGDFRGRRLRFPHYGLALWLLHLKPLAADLPPDRERKQIADLLQIHLRQRLGGNDFAENLADAVGDFPWWVRLTARSMPRLGLALMRLSWRPPRWFARQRIATGHRQDFYRLARAFAQDGFAKAHAEQVDALLTDAFRQDLRVAYRRGSVLGAGRRRTAYPVLLVDAGSEPADRLLALIEKSRSTPVQRRPGTRARLRRDPLLVITDPGTGTQPTPTYPLDAEPAYEAWLQQQQPYGGKPPEFLELTLPAATGGPGTWRDLSKVGLPRRRRPWLAYVLPVLIVAAVILLPVANYRRNYDNCDPVWSLPHAQTLEREPIANSDDGQCIGLAAPSRSFFGPPPPGAEAYAAQLTFLEYYIDETNAAVVKDPDYVSVVFLSTLTNTTADGYPAMIEELSGLALAQRETLIDAVPIRLLLGNAGDRMDHGGRAAELIAAHRDELRIVAVTGLGVSREGVRQAMRVLDAAGIPTLGTLLTADALTSTVISYHQVGPPNRREAAVAAYYAKAKKKITEASIYFSGDVADLYSSNLAADVRTEFVAAGITVRDFAPYRTVAGTEGGDITALGRQACSARAGYLVFFAGRPDEFGQFLYGMRTKCPGDYPAMLAGDAITEFALSKRQNDFAGLRLDYLSPASSLVWGRDCAAAKAAVPNFFADYEVAGFGKSCDNGQEPRAMFGYDAISTLRTAVGNVHAIRPGERVAPDKVGLALDKLSVEGVTGRIDFAGGVNPQVPVDKAMLVVGTDDTGKPTLQLLCGEIATAARPDPGCPSG